MVFNDDGIQVTYNSVSVETNESADGIGIALGTQGIDATNTTTGNVTNALVANNKINGIASLSTTGFSAAGITVAGGTTGVNTIANNMISGVTAPATSPDIVAGIYVVGAIGSNTRVLYNTISLSGDRGAVPSQTPSFGIAITGTDPTVRLTNNIISTTQIASGGGVNAKSYAVGMVSTVFANLDSNYNAYWSDGANDGGFRTGSLATAAGIDYATLALYAAAVADDANSLETLPTFVSATDLHLDIASSAAFNAAATPIAGLTIDFDCGVRDTSTPDIGADEFSNSSTINLKLFIEGYYDTSIGAMRSVKNNQDGVSPVTDVENITVELHNPTSPFGIAASTTAVLKTDGTAVCTFSTAPSGSFYIAVRNSNAAQTWSKDPQTVGTTPLSYDFSTAANKAYADNMIQVGTVFAFYSGDINQDDVIDGSDATSLDLDIFNSETGVRPTDLNGDGSVDGSDSVPYENNSFNSVFAVYPPN